MPKAPFPSVIQRMIYCQIGSGNQFLGPNRLRRVGVFALEITNLHMNIKSGEAEVVKK
jgi:hypothetical protein